MMKLMRFYYDKVNVIQSDFGLAVFYMRSSLFWVVAKHVLVAANNYQLPAYTV
jgi:hypothetical protein